MLRRLIRTVGIVIALAFFGFVSLVAWSFWSQEYGLALWSEEAFVHFKSSAD